MAASVTLEEMHVVDSMRTVVLRRNLQGRKSDEYFSFSTTTPTLTFIAAVGASATFGYHKNKAPTSITLVAAQPEQSPTRAGACICPNQPKPFGEASGQLVYHPVANQTAGMHVLEHFFLQ